MIQLPELPYNKDALEPHITSNTLDFHHDKHHQAYVTNLNNLIAGTDFENASLEKIINDSHSDPSKTAIFNNAAQIWNHTFYWNSMCPNGGGKPSGALLSKINETWGSFDEFSKVFIQGGIGQFGRGWVWLVMKDGALSIMKTLNADLPMVHGATALLTCDVWEHAYYLDYQNRRPAYLEVFLANLANWNFASENYENNL